MNSFEMERTLLVGVALTAVCCFFGTLIGLLAKLKGYSFLAWFGTGGSILLAAIILAFQPKVRGTELTREEIDVKIEKGNRIGWILSLFVFVGILLSVTLWLTSMSFEDVEPEMFFQRYWVPAVQWCNWPWLIANCLMLLRFLYLPRSEKSWLKIAAFTILAIQIVFPFALFWIDKLGGVDSGTSPFFNILRFTVEQMGSVGILLLYFAVTEPKKTNAMGS
ncbi:MAG: hypothetical protein ACK56W_24325 [Pirellula sp.]|jgi:hypothetical protein|nr:hypothetical protein [Pirellula sp.]